MRAPISVHYHLNLNHSALSDQQRMEYVFSTFGEIVSEITVPTTISACAEDLLVLRSASPAAWQSFITNKNIRYLPSLYSHTLAELFPETFVKQAEACAKIATHILPARMISTVGFPPELSLVPSEAIASICKLWRGSVYCDTRAATKNGERLPPVFKNSAGLIYAMSARNVVYRTAFERYLREKATMQDVLAALKYDSDQAHGQWPVIARIDLEAIIFNRLRLGDDLMPPRIDLFTALQNAYKHSDQLEFVFADDAILTRTDNIPILDIAEPADGSVDKWQRRDRLSILKSLWKSDISRPPLHYWSALTSHYFTSQRPNVVHAGLYKGAQGTLSIIFDPSAKQSEFMNKVTALKQHIDPASNTPYLKLLNRATRDAYEILQPLYLS